MQYLVNISCNSNSLELLRKLDKKLIGTNEYMGIAYYWHYDFRHYLRDASAFQRTKVHHAFIRAKLDVSGFSPLHEAIVTKIIGK